MADLTTLRTWLSEAEAARHALALGQSVVEVVRDGRRMRFNEQDGAHLDTYIADLVAQIAQLEDAANGTSLTRRRAIVQRWA